MTRAGVDTCKQRSASAISDQWRRDRWPRTGIRLKYMACPSKARGADCQWSHCFVCRCSCRSSWAGGSKGPRAASILKMAPDSATVTPRARSISAGIRPFELMKKAFTALFTCFEVHERPVIRHTHFFKQDGELPAVLGGIDQTELLCAEDDHASSSVTCLASLDVWLVSSPLSYLHPDQR